MSLSKLYQFRHLAMEERWKEIESFFNDSLQLQQVRAEVNLSMPDRPRVTIAEVTEMHRGGIGGEAVNGGVIAMMVDLTMGLLGLRFYDEGMTATAHLSIHYLKPLKAQRVTFESEITEVVGNRIFGMVNALNEGGEICCHATGVLVKGIKT